MFASEQYELIDFGDGRKLERFGSLVLDRPCPAADGIEPADPPAWRQAIASYRKRGNSGEWQSKAADFERLLDVDLASESANDGSTEETASGAGANWAIQHRQTRFLLRPTAFGHVGVFPEQAANWLWIARQVKRCVAMRDDRPPRVLNLFAYTGGSTLAAAAAGAEVVHVDAAKNTVAWARRNAAASGLGEAPIRWIVDDAVKFVQREVRRGNQYDGIILDPPSYGHGPKGQSWKISQGLLPLLSNCAKLTSESRQFILLTCHAPDFDAAEVEASLAQAVFGSCAAGAMAKPLDIKTRSGRKLNAGVVARWPG